MTRGSVGDWNKLAKNPEANSRYMFKNGYVYDTDAAGRVSNVEADLQLGAWDRNGYQQGVAGRECRLSTDCGGHLIASMFGGPGEAINLVAMDTKLNGTGGGSYRLEQSWKQGLSKVPPDSIQVKVQPLYAETGSRPTSFTIRQVVNGVEQPLVVLKNGGGR